MSSGLGPRALLALYAGKATGALSRRLGIGGGTTFPGDVARFIDPHILARLGAGLPEGVILVTGTNGKTTTALVLRGLLGAGRRVVANPAGANLVFGLTAAMVAAARPRGGPWADLGVFEVDEFSFARALAELNPRVVVVGNLFRDQLDRHGELEAAAVSIAGALTTLPATSTVCLNADDPLVASMAAGLAARVSYFGLGRGAPSRGSLSPAADSRFCPRCGTPLQFGRVSVGHLGNWACPGCGFARPEPDLALDDLRLDGLASLSGVLRGAGAEVAVRLPISGVYNAYNLLGAVSAAAAMDMDPVSMVPLLSAMAPAFGRMEAFDLDGVRATFLLAKNPTGFDESLRAAVEAGRGRSFLIAINDRIADGRDVSWLWDVDFESLAPRAREVTVTGLRAADMAVRLKYGGLDQGMVTLETELEAALDGALARTRRAEEADLFILTTYTAMLGLRAILERRGLARRYWQETA